MPTRRKSSQSSRSRSKSVKKQKRPIMTPNEKTFMEFERKILLKRMNPEAFKANVSATKNTYGIGTATAIRIMFNRYVGDLIGVSFPAVIEPDKEDETVIMDYEDLPEFRG